MGWGEMKGKGEDEMEDIHSKPINELLGIDKPKEWTDKQWDIAQHELEDKGEIYSGMLNQFLRDSGQIPFAIAIKLNNLEETLASVTRLFYSLGYMKGKITQEADDKLDNLWGKGS